MSNIRAIVNEPGELAFEVCVVSAAGADAALTAGADRVELCASLEVGGITPSAGLIGRVVERAAGRLAVHVLVRPRGGDFVYSAAEEDVMSRDIAAARAAGADGVVIGALTAAGAVDVPMVRRLIEVARPLGVTFHRAFDETADPAAAFADVLALGADRLLTSGGAPTALEGADLIETLVDRSGEKIAVMAGSGVTERTAADLVRRTGVRELHFSARTAAPDRPLAERISRIMAAALARS
ncbi:MAG TPA: copper homeostasis protein CutC [Trebonia sp.]|nr:copper homeostasis protein CutC [Trebonia sp.]